jgi:death-on-curing protein
VTVWVTKQVIVAIHDEQLARYGGPAGIRDEELLKSALARPLNLEAYGTPSIAELGATYAIALVRNHPFVDGNKRIGWMAMVTFFGLNGVAFEPPEAEAVVAMLDLAGGDLPEPGFIGWVTNYASAAD